MSENALLSLSAIVTLVPAALLPLRRDHSRDFTFWALLAVAVAGPLSSVLASLGGIWRTDLSMTLWVTVA
ncbi:MAG: hypothetical protein HYS64_03110, partial [Rhodospirillales bacterium]|nr:hypothetical protein [Rhodospirillales bacterium]